MARRALLCGLLILTACAGTRGGEGRFEAADEGDCGTVDSMLASSGWRRPLEMEGKVTFDVKQYRVRGRFRLTTQRDGNLTFEFSGTTALGGHHEDVVVSFYEDTLRVLDRERGRFYEGEEANSIVAEGLDVDWDVGELLRRVTMRTPACSRLSAVSARPGKGGGDSRLEGRIDGERFRVDFAEGGAAVASWPVEAAGGVDDRLRVTYEWRSGDAGAGPPRLEKLVAFFEGKRWRIILEAS